MIFLTFVLAFLVGVLSALYRAEAARRSDANFVLEHHRRVNRLPDAK